MSDPNQSLQDLLSASSNASPFGPNSRYYSLPFLTYPAGSTAGGIRYVARRFISPPGRFRVVQEIVVQEGDRLDNLSAHYLGDPEAFWRICDANVAMRPDELTETPGRRINITLPAELSGE